MSMETELKKIAVNLQQLTDAVTTLTAVMEIHKPVVIPAADDSVKAEPIPMREAAGELIGTVGAIATDTVTADANNAKIAEDNVVDIGKASEEPMTMAEANAELNRIVGVIGDKGVSIRELLKNHNAITLAQIPADQYRLFVTEAEALITAKTA